MELTVDNLVDFFNNESIYYSNCKYTMRVTISCAYDSIIDSLLNNFYGKVVVFNYLDDLYFKLYSKDVYLEKYFNINYIEFDLLIPRIVVNLYKKHKLNVTCKEYYMMYCFMVDNYHEIYNKLSEKSAQFFYYIINDVIQNKSNKYNIINKSYIKNYIDNMFSKLDKYLFTNDYNLYIEDKFLNTKILDEFNIPYNINNISILFLGFDRFIYEKNGNIIKHNVDAIEYNCYYKTLIDEFIIQSNILNRNKKILNLI